MPCNLFKKCWRKLSVLHHHISLTLARKYKFMESSMLRRSSQLQTTIPDMQKALDTVLYLTANREKGNADEPITAHFELNDTLYASAEIPAGLDEVYLWLGVGLIVQ